MWTARLDSAEWGQKGQDASLIGTSLKTVQRRNSEAGAGCSQNLDLRTSRHKRHRAHSGFIVNPVDLAMHTAASEVERIEDGRVLWNTGRQMERATVRCVGELQRAERLLETMHDVCYNSRIQ